MSPFATVATFFAKTAVFATRNCHRLESLPHLLHLTELRHSEHFKEPSLRISNFSSRRHLTQIYSTKHSKNLFGSFLDLKWSITFQFFEGQYDIFMICYWGGFFSSRDTYCMCQVSLSNVVNWCSRYLFKKDPSL